MTLLSFEGIDGSGKTTQINLLKKYLQSLGHDVYLFREPGGTELSELIRGILLNPDIEIDPVTEMLLFSSARSQLIAEKVLPLLNTDAIVILDRFYDSTVAYQGYGRKSVSLEQVHQLNRIAAHGLVPQVTFYLRVDLEIAENRRSNLTKDRMERSGDDFFNSVISGFDELSAHDPRFIRLDASRSIDDLHLDICSIVRDKIKNNSL
jgi:dTMP kinase